MSPIKPLVSAVLILGFVATTKRKSERKGSFLSGFIGFPDVINMLDNERTRWLNSILFFAMGWALTLMILDPNEVDIPFDRIRDPTFNFILKKLLTIGYYLVVFAPIVMGLPRYDLYGGVVAMLYTWLITIHNYIRDYSCAFGLTWLFHVLEHISWTLLSLAIPSLLVYVSRLGMSHII